MLTLVTQRHVESLTLPSGKEHGSRGSILDTAEGRGVCRAAASRDAIHPEAETPTQYTNKGNDTQQLSQVVVGGWAQARKGNGSVLNYSRGLGALGEDRCGTVATLEPFHRSVAVKHRTSVRCQRAASLGG